jgi:hypothetical protein
MSSKRSPDSDEMRIKDIRWLREMADFLVNNANRHHATLIAQLGLKRYIFNALGKAAHQSADSTQLVWPDDTEQVEGSGAKLGEYLYTKYQKKQRLPQAILMGSEVLALTKTRVALKRSRAIMG